MIDEKIMPSGVLLGMARHLPLLGGDEFLLPGLGLFHEQTIGFNLEFAPLSILDELKPLETRFSLSFLSRNEIES